MSSYSEIWNRIDECLTAFDEIIAEIGEELLPAKNEYDENIIETKLVIQQDNFEKLQRTYDKLEDLNIEIMKDAIRMNDEKE